MKALEIASTQPWAILPVMLETIVSIASRETDPEAVAAKLGRPLENTYKTEIRDGVAILPITGPVMRYANLFSKVSGATSIDVLATDFNEALNNPNVKAIVLEIDSPGGTVSGVNELAEMVYAARGKKPITAYVSGMGASAAYWLACAADEIALDATASVGSIGVVSVQTDDTERKAKAGIKDIQIVSSVSPRKRPDLGTEEGRADVQALVDSMANVFVNTVARNRGVSIDTVLTDFGQGGLLVGADAIKAGMAERIGSLESVIAGLSGLTKGVTMTNPLKSEAPELSAEIIAAQYPTIAEGFRLEGATRERERIRAVEEQLIPGHEALIQSLKFDGKTTSAEAAVQILAAIKQANNSMLANLKADAPQVIPMPAVSHADKTESAIAEDELPEDEKHEAAWRKDAKLRAEFGSKEAYFAFMKAQSKGQIRILQR